MKWTLGEAPKLDPLENISGFAPAQKLSLPTSNHDSRIGSASIVLDTTGNLIAVPILTQIGISNTETMKNFLLELSLKIEDQIEELNEIEISNDDYLKDILKKIIIKEMKMFFSIRPIISIHINRVQ